MEDVGLGRRAPRKRFQNVLTVRGLLTCESVNDRVLVAVSLLLEGSVGEDCCGSKVLLRLQGTINVVDYSLLSDRSLLVGQHQRDFPSRTSLNHFSGLDNEGN